MSDPNRRNLPAAVPKPGSLLDTAFSELSPEDQLSLKKKALEKRLELEGNAMAADLRHRASTADMQNTIDQVRDLERSSKSDYAIRSEYETASGRTNIEVKKSNSTVIIVIAIAIAVAVIVMFSK